MRVRSGFVGVVLTVCLFVQSAPAAGIYNGNVVPAAGPHVSLSLLAGGTFGGSFCSGTLIAAKWVLTAAHCADAYESSYASFELIVVYGDADLSVAFSDGKYALVESLNLPADWSLSPYTPDSDIALLGLETAVSGVTPADLPSEAVVVDDPVRVVGVEIGEVKLRYADRVISLIDGNVYVTHDAMTGLCTGDSGGGVMVGAAFETIVGVNAATAGCGPGTSGFHTAVYPHRSWIHDVAEIGGDDSAPIVEDVAATPDPVAVGEVVTITATVADSESSIQTAEYRWRRDGSTAWASGALSAVDGAFDELTEDVTAINSWFSPGVYELCVVATDSSENTSPNEAACTHFALFDPDGGFVVGSGTVHSSVEADSVNGATGGARFTFVSKYAKGRTTPDGMLQFQFMDGAIDFHSTDQTWLVITNEPRARLQGTGVLNGERTCSYEVRAWDSTTDLFGLRIFSCDGLSGDRYHLSQREITRGDIKIKSG